MAVGRLGRDVGRQCRRPPSLFQRIVGGRYQQRYLSTDVGPVLPFGAEFPQLRFRWHHFVTGMLNFCRKFSFFLSLVDEGICHIYFTIPQIVDNDRLTLSLLPANQGGRLSLNLLADGTDMITESGFDLGDNRWHDVDLKFHQDQLQIRLDGDDWMPVVNASLVGGSPLFQRRLGDNSERSVTLGRGFSGCLLEGPSLSFASVDRNVAITACPIPLGTNSECFLSFPISRQKITTRN